MTKTVRELYRKLNNNNEIPTIEGQGNFTADEMIWFAEQAVKLFAIPVVNARIFNVGEKAKWRGIELFVAEVGNSEVLLATDMDINVENYNDWWVSNVYVR